MDPARITLSLLVRDWAIERWCERCFSIAWPGEGDTLHYVVITSTKTVPLADDGPYSDFEYVIYARRDSVTIEEHPNIVSVYKTEDPGMFEKLDKLVKCQCTNEEIARNRTDSGLPDT